jgi:hypothetical protein
MSIMSTILIPSSRFTGFGSPIRRGGVCGSAGKAAPRAGIFSSLRESAPGGLRVASVARITRCSVVMAPSSQTFKGIIESTDGAVTYFDYQGYGRTYPAGRRQIVSSATHVSDYEQYRWLNDVVCVGIGEVRARGGSPTELVLDVAELIWQPVLE